MSRIGRDDAMKAIQGKTAGFLAAMMVFATAGHAQAPAMGAKLHGHVNNAAGVAVVAGDVKLTKDKSPTTKEKDRVFEYTFPLDASGNYKGADIGAGEYVAVVQVTGKTIDFQDITIKKEENRTLDFDMTRAEYLKGMTAEDKAALEEFKKKNASVTAENSKIQNINKTLLQAREDEKNGKAADAVASLKGVIGLRPDEAILWASLGEAQLADGDQQSKAAKAAKADVKTPEILANYKDAGTSYQKAIDLYGTSKKSTPENLAAYYLNLGQSLSKGGDVTTAGAAYEMAAKTAPAMAGSAYYNEAVIYYQASPPKLADAVVAAEKSIAADPKRADAYYIKGQALIPGATADPKTGKFILPAGCLEAYQEYLELAPEGAHATEVKELLGGLGQPVKNSFKAGRK